MDGRQREYSLDRSRLFSAAGLVMTPTYLEPPSASALLRSMPPELSRPAPTMPSSNLVTSYPQYHGRCSSAMSVTSGSNFSFLSGMLGSMPSPAASPFRANPAGANIRHFWPPVSSTPDDYERRLPCSQYPLMSSCSQFCRCQQQAPLGYGRCSGLFSPCYSQSPRFTSSPYQQPHLYDTAKDLMFPSGIQLGAMIPTSQPHITHASPGTPALDLERNSLNQMEYFTKGLETPTCCVGTELWTDNRINNRNNNNSDTNNNSNKKRDLHARQQEQAKVSLQSNEATSKESRAASKTSEKCKESSQPVKGETPPHDKIKDEYQKEVACQKRSPQCNGNQGDKLYILPEKVGTPPSKVNGETPPQPNGSIDCAISKLSGVSYKDRRKKDKPREKRYDKTLELAVKGAPSDKWGVATQAAVTITTVTVTTTTLTQSRTTTTSTTAAGLGKAAFQVHPHENSSPIQVSPGCSPHNAVPIVPPDFKLMSSSCPQQWNDALACSLSSTPCVTTPTFSTTSNHVLQHSSQPSASSCDGPMTQNGMKYTSAVVSDANKTWEAVHTAQCVGDKDTNTKKMSVHQKNSIEAPVIKKENKYETSCGKWRDNRPSYEATNITIQRVDKVPVFSPIVIGEGACDVWNKGEHQHVSQTATPCHRPRSQHGSRRKKDSNDKVKDSVSNIKLRNVQCGKAITHKNEAKVTVSFQCPSTNHDYEQLHLQSALPELTTKAGVFNHPAPPTLTPVPCNPMASAAKPDPSATTVISIHNGVVPSEVHTDTAAALHPQYVFDWQSPQPQYSPASVTTLPAHSGYLIQPSPQAITQSLPSSVSENTSRQGAIIVQTLPKNVIASIDPPPPTNILMDSHRLHNPGVREGNANISCADIRENSSVAQVMPLPLVGSNTNEKITPNAQEQTTEGSVLMHNPTVSLNIPVGIAVARQRQEQNSSYVKRSDDVTDVIRNASPASCLRSDFLRESRELQKQTSTADYSSNLILTSGTGPAPTQWDEPSRPAASLPPPWATTSHNPAYWLPQGHFAAATAPLPIQINPMDPAHLPIPPVGYQLARDSLTGHLLLIPTNLDIMERSTVWSTYATSTPHIQPSHQLQQLMVQQQIIQQDQHRSLEYRLALPPQFPGNDCIKTQISSMQTTGNVEVLPEGQNVTSCDIVNPVNARLEKSGEKESSSVSLSTTTAPGPTQPILASIPIATGQPFSYAFPATSTLPFFFANDATSVVQLAQAAQTENGRRSQGTSPVPMDDCMITPVEQGAQTLDDSDTCESSRTGAEFVVTQDEPQVADASNQTETPPLTEEENDSVDMEVSCKEEDPVQEYDKSDDHSLEKHEVDSSANQSDVCVQQMPLHSPPHSPQCSPVQSPQHSPAQILPHSPPQNSLSHIPPPSPPCSDGEQPQAKINEFECADFHGLELLSNSIEKYEESHSNKMTTVADSTSGKDNSISNDFLQSKPTSLIQELVDSLELVISDEVSRKALLEKDQPSCLNTELQTTDEEDHTSVRKHAKEFCGLGLLCALAEQRFNEENWTAGRKKEMVITRSKSTATRSPDSTVKDSAALEPLPDINRCYRNPKSQKEFQNFIATKMSQYSCSSPGHRSPVPGDGPMDAIELDMRMRLAELQRRYKQKQKELAKLQPKKEKEELEKSPVKRGPGRPRKRKYSGAKKLIRPSMDCLVKALVKLDSPPHVLHASMEEPVKKKKKKSRDSESHTHTSKLTPVMKPSDPITPKKPILKPSVLKSNQLSPSVSESNKLTSSTFTQLTVAAHKLDSFHGKQHILFSSPSHHSHLSTPAIKTVCDLSAATVKVHVVNLSAEKIPNSILGIGLANSVTKESGTSEPNSKGLSPPKLTTPIQFSMKEDTTNTKVADKKKVMCKEGLQESRPENSIGASLNLGNQLPAFDDTTGLGLLAKFAMQAAEENKLSESYAKKPSDANAAKIETVKKFPSDSTTPPLLPNKRKPGRPKKHSQCKTKDATETIVAKKPKKMNFLKPPCADDNKSKVSSPKQEASKTINSSPQKAFYLEDEGWNRRRSERIFLNDLNITPSGSYAENNRSVLSPPQLKPATEDSPTWKSKTDEHLKPPKNLTRAPDVGKLKKKSISRPNAGASPPPPKKRKKDKERSKRTNDRAVSDELFQALKDKCCLNESSYCGLSPRDSDSDNIESSSSYSEGENLPLSQLVERPVTPEPRSCLIRTEELTDKMRVLTLMDGLFYAGHINAIQAPDVYGITIDGGRSNRPHIYSREEILKLAFLEVNPGSIRYLPEGTRICAYWSQQYRCLYPGTVAKSTSPNPLQDKTSVYVEFDDGDSGRIPLIDIRLLHQGFPTVSYDPSPLVYQGKRRSRSTAENCCDSKGSTSDDIRSPSSHKTNKIDDSSVSTTNRLNLTSNSKSSKSAGSDSRSPENKKKSKRSKSESRSRDKDIPKTKTKDTESKNNRQPSLSSTDSSKPRKHKKHKERSDEHRHHHHHHHHKRKHKHERHDKHMTNVEEKGRDKTPTKSASIVDVSTNAIVKTSTCHADVNKSELTMRIKTSATDLKQPVKATSKTSEAKVTVSTITQETSESCKVNSQVEEKELIDIGDSCDEQSLDAKSETKQEDHVRLKKRKERIPSSENKSKMAAFLPARQLWRWSGKSFKRPGTKGRAKKEFYKAITRGRETISVGDCAVFLSTGRPHLPYIGRIEMMWEGWGGNMVVRVKWFYHPEETKGGKKLTNVKGALYQSPHEDENDVQTISHKCEVLSWRDFRKWRDHETSHSPKYGSIYDNNDVYYLAGTYDPTTGVVTMEPGIC